MGLIIFVHTVICILLGIAILMQSGRGGGLTESMASAESLFGAKTNSFMVKTTTVLTVLFFITCLSLAIFSTKRETSLMRTTALPMRGNPANMQELNEDELQVNQTTESTTNSTTTNTLNP